MAADPSSEQNGHQQPFAIIPRAALANAAKFQCQHSLAVWAALRSYADQKTRLAWPSKERLGADLGIDARLVRRAVAELLRFDWIEDAGMAYRNTRRYRVHEGGRPGPGSARAERCRKKQAQPGHPGPRTRTPGSPNPILIRPEEKTKICADAHALESPEGEPDPDGPTGRGAEAGEREDRTGPEPTARAARSGPAPSLVAVLTEMVVNGDKIKLWQAISAAGIRLGGRERFRMLAQEEQTRQAVALLLGFVRVKGWPEDRAGLLMWAWRDAAGEGAAKLAELRKACSRISRRVRPMIEEAMQQHPDSTFKAEPPEESEAAAALHRDRENQLQAIRAAERLKRPWTQAEKDLQAKLDLEIASGKIMVPMPTIQRAAANDE